MNIDKIGLKKYIIQIKFSLREMYKLRKCFIQNINQYQNLIKLNEDIINDYRSDKSIIQDILMLRKIKDFETNNDTLRGCIDVNKDKIKKISEEIYAVGDMVLCLNSTIDDLFTLQEKIHLISGNTESCNDIIRYNKEHGEKEPDFLGLIVEHGEYQRSKQRTKGIIDCPKWEMPLFNAVLKPMIKKITGSGISLLDCPVFEQMPYYTMDTNGELKKNKPEVVREDENVTIVRF